MALKGTNQEFGRPYNRRIVLETIRRQGPLAKAAIAQHVGLTVQTVSNITRELEEQGFVTSARTAPRGRGQPAHRLSINPDGPYAIGINISPHSLEAASLNLAGGIIATRQMALRNPQPEETLKQVLDMAAELRRALPGRRVLGIGLAMPGPFDVDSMSFKGPTTLEGWQGVPVQERLSRGTRLPVFVEADHAAAALGEQLYGAGRGLKDFYHIYVGAGLGGSMVADGQLLRGAHRNAGELGHLPLVPDGLACPCGNRGCLERYLSLEAYARRCAEAGHAAWLREAAPLLRQALVIVENLFDPEQVILGGLADVGLLHELAAAAEPLASSVANSKARMTPRLAIASGGPQAVLRGAAALAVWGVLAPRFGLMFAGDEAAAAADPMFRHGEAA